MQGRRTGRKIVAAILSAWASKLKVESFKLTQLCLWKVRNKPIGY